MKISVEWLKEYVDIKESPEKLKEDLSMIGLLVEAITEVRGTVVLEVEVTSNRPDCLSHIGIAREIAALYGRPLRYPPMQQNLSISPDRVPYKIEIKDADLCPGTSDSFWMESRSTRRPSGCSGVSRRQGCVR